MNNALPALFALAGLCSVAAIWHAVSANWDAIARLRQQVALPNYGSEVSVVFREHVVDLESIHALRRPRQVRVPAPKPITHRLHHFVKTRTAA